MAQVFLSYSRADSARIEPLAHALEKAGHSVWWDRRLSGGSEIDGVIETALNEAEVVVVAWSEEASRSAWVRDEAAVGRDRNRLVPLTLDGKLPPLGFRQFHTIDLSRWRGSSRSAEFAALEQAIVATSGSRGAPAVARAGEAPARQSTRRPPSRWPTPRFAMLGGPILLIAAAIVAAIAFGSPFGRSQAPMTVQLASFAPLGGDVPPDTARIFGEELREAFGQNNPVAIKDRGGTFLLGGSLQRSGGKLRYSIKLIDGRTSENLLSASFDTPPSAGDLASRQAAVSFASVIRCGLADAMEHPGRLKANTLSLYLQHCRHSYLAGGCCGNAEGGLDVIRKVVAQAPDFSRGWSALAAVAAAAADFAPPEKQARLRKESSEAVNRALALDPRNGRAYLAAAMLQPTRAWKKREELHRRSIEVRGSDCGCEHEGYGYFLLSAGRPGEAVAQYARARDMQPNSPSASQGLASAYYAQGDFMRGDQVVSEMDEFWRGASVLQLLRLQQAFYASRWADAAKVAPELIPSPHASGLFVEAYDALASRDAARIAAATSALQKLRPGPGLQMRAATFAALGDKRSALQMLDQMLAMRQLDGAFLLEPALANLRNEPEFSTLLQKLGLLRYWRESRKRPDMCSSTSAPKFCAAIG